MSTSIYEKTEDGEEERKQKNEHGLCHSWRSAVTGSPGERRGEKESNGRKGRRGKKRKKEKKRMYGISRGPHGTLQEGAEEWGVTDKNERVKR